MWRCGECREWGSRVLRNKKWAKKDFEFEHSAVHDNENMKIYKVDGRKFKKNVVGKSNGVEYKELIDPVFIVDRVQHNNDAEDAVRPIDKDWMYS